MTRYVIGPDTAIQLARAEAVIPGGHQVLAPTLLRSQLLSLLYQAVRRGEMEKRDAERRLDYIRGLRTRLLGDRVQDHERSRLGNPVSSLSLGPHGWTTDPVVTRPDLRT
jgi:hypothetical protein